MTLDERWAPVFGWEDLYEVSELGRVRSLPRTRWCGPNLSVPRTWPGKILTQCRRNAARPYLFVILNDRARSRSVFVHHLVLEAFVGPRPEGMEARHLNGDPADNRLANLGWSTHVDNCSDKVAHGTVQVGERHPRAKFTDEDVRAIRRAAASGASRSALARLYGVWRHTIDNIVCRKSWRHVAD